MPRLASDALFMQLLSKNAAEVKAFKCCLGEEKTKEVWGGGGGGSCRELKWGKVKGLGFSFFRLLVCCLGLFFGFLSISRAMEFFIFEKQRECVVAKMFNV